VPTDQLDPNTVASISEEQRLIRHRKQYPVGSRRRRAILSSLKNAVPFEQLPYQCFQEARKLLAEDRQEKLRDIAKMRTRIANLQEQDATISGGEPAKQHRLNSMRRELERLKILADINDPMVKKRFEDGMGKATG
jgi:large subunit ribosomal protein L35